MEKLGLKLKAGTLIESLVAMVIIIVCLGVGTMIYSNVLNSDKQRFKFKAILMLNKEAEQIKMEKNFLDGEKILGDYMIRKIITKMPQSENLYRLSLIVFDKSGKSIGVRNELIFTE